MANNQELIGFHKGAISTLLKEREEFVKMVGVIDQLLKAHLKALKELGVKFENPQPVQEKDEELDDKLENLLK